MLNHHLIIVVAFATLGAVNSSEDGDTGCREHEHQCLSGKCIMNVWICDGQADCPDKDDEAICGDYKGPNVCDEGELQCRNGNCMSGHFRCDGVTDCADGIDEEDCNPPDCGEGKFSCRSGSPRCISADWECDGENDCEDGSDEQNCHNTTRSEDDCYGFSCDNHRCIVESRVCDGQNDCGDSSDEKRCTAGMCSPAEFQCGDGKCIDASYKCDGIDDCEDNSDELGCDPECNPLREISCIDGTCIPFEHSCDGEIHCPDASDEFNCGSVNCTAEQFTCKSSGICINKDWVCDSHSDCEDSSDELGCAPVTCEEGQFQCDARMCIPLEERCDGIVDCANGADETHCGNCSATEEYQCDNSKCISLQLLCDNSDDCGDSSDERNCFTRQCSEEEFLCNNGKCIDKSSMCDGEHDCFGSEDETDYRCAIDECTHFRCGSGECVDNDWVCDGENDCADHSDEQDCDESGDISGGISGGCNGYTCLLTRQCISAEKECNKNIDCLDGTDELHCGENECALGTHECSHGCIDAIIGYNCFCPSGYELAEDNRNCVDIDECSQEPEQCQHFCFNNRGGYRCECADGYVLEDTRRCRQPGVNELPTLFFSTNEGISSLGDHGRTDYVEERLNKITKFEVDKTQYVIIYYTAKTDTIHKFDMTSNVTSTLYENVDTDTLTLDSQNSQIYWSDRRHMAIMRGDYSGSTPVQFLNTTDSLPHALDFSSKRGALFWGVHAQGIKMTTLEDMVTIDVVVNQTDFGLIADLKVDDLLDRVYWADPRNSQIHYLDRNSNLHVIERNISYPVALAIFENSLFYLDQQTVEIINYDRLTGMKNPIPLTVPINYFQIIIHKEFIDGIPDLVTCNPDEILCDGSCVNRDLICDGQKHCSGTTREDLFCDQPLTCGDMFKCADNTTCIPSTWICDGHEDCGDGSDENQSACHETPCNLNTHFRCDSGRCIGRLWRCDGQADCEDESDEANCTANDACREGQLKCGDGACITDEMRCNGVYECEDGADERNCEKAEFCRQSQFTFTCDDTCIPDHWVCDGKVDCADQRDERNCYICPEEQTWSRSLSKCTDKTPCQLANCQQKCNKGTCSCEEGYYMADDGRTCLVTLSPVLLALVQLPQQSGLIQLDHVQMWELGKDGGARSRAAEQLSNALSLDNVLALDYHYSLQKAVYADAAQRSIMVTPMSDRADEVLSKEVFHFGDTLLSDVVVDWVSDNIYWTNQTSHALMVGNMDGSMVVELLKLETTPHHLTMDPIRGDLYWIGSVGAHTDIYTCSRNGDGVRPLFWRQFRATSLAVDTTTGILYWYDSHHLAIFSNMGYGEAEYSTIARNISHAENLNYYNGNLYWVSDTDEGSELVTFNVMSREVTNSQKLSRRPFKLRLYQENMQRVYNPKLLSCRNNKGGCDDLCFAGSGKEPRQCGCVYGINSMKICMSEYATCDPGYCLGDSWCSFSNQNQTCSCGVGYHGDQCQWTLCQDTQDTCSGNKMCYHNSVSNLKHCCHENAKGCSGIPKHSSTQTITRTKNHYDYTTLITVGLAIAITLGILATAVGYRKWKRSRGRLRSSTLVDMYPMEPVQDDLRQEDDEPLLYD